MDLKCEKGIKNVLVAVTGSVATIKIEELVSSLSLHFNVILVTTQSASHFFDIQILKQKVQVFADEDEYNLWNQKGDPVLHIELRKWADALVIAPLSANTLAKIACGLCDNLVTCIVRAWDFEKPFIVAPAMNTLMWTNKFTATHLQVIEDQLGGTIIHPISKVLACADVGVGAMASVQSIVETVIQNVLGNDNDSATE